MIIDFVESIVGSLEGQLFKLGYETRETLVAAEAIKPGRFVCRSTTDNDAKLPTTSEEVRKCLGITELGDTFPLNSSGEYASGTFLPVIAATRGITVVTIDAATKGGLVYVNYAGSNPKGSISAAFVDGENTPLQGARFVTTQATPGGKVAIAFTTPSPGSLQQSFGSGKGYVDVVVDLGAQSAGAVAEVSTTVTGASAGDTFVVTSLTALNSTIVICDARCRVDGTVVWRIFNASGTPDPASNTFRFSLVSREQG